MGRSSSGSLTPTEARPHACAEISCAGLNGTNAVFTKRARTLDWPAPRVRISATSAAAAGYPTEPTGTHTFLPIVASCRITEDESAKPRRSGHDYAARLTPRSPSAANEGNWPHAQHNPRSGHTSRYVELHIPGSEGRAKGRLVKTRAPSRGPIPYHINIGLEKDFLRGLVIVGIAARRHEGIGRHWPTVLRVHRLVG